MPALRVQVGVSMDVEELTELFLVADITGQGMIDYEEFIASMLDSQRVAMRTDAVRSSFEKLDRDGDGYISVQDLHQVRGMESGVGCVFCGCHSVCGEWPAQFGWK